MLKDAGYCAQLRIRAALFLCRTKTAACGNRRLAYKKPSFVSNMGDERVKYVNPVSDTEHEEKPVREQLQKASISQEAVTMAEVSARSESEQELHLGENGADTGTTERTPSPPRKRSFEDVEEASQRDRSSRPKRQPSRKRSRDSTAEEDELNNGQRKSSSERARDGDEDAAETNGAAQGSTSNTKAATPESQPEQRTDTVGEIVGSPKIKRSRLHSATLEEAEDTAGDTLTTATDKDTSESTKPAQPSTSESKDEAATPEPQPEQRTDTVDEIVGSPKIKRSRLHSATLEEAEDTAGDTLTTATDKDTSESTKPAQPSTSESKDEAATTAKPSVSSGFSNTAESSPFASVSGSKSPALENGQRSPFAASGFSALSGSTVSGFGALSKNAGGFGTGAAFGKGGKEPLGDDKLTPAPADDASELDKEKAIPSTTFGGSLGQKSAFGGGGTTNAGGGFGSGAGFGSKVGQGTGFGGFGTGKGLSSFASGKPPVLGGGNAGLKAAKAFGAPADDEDGEGEDEEESGEGGGDEAGFRSPLSQESDKQDERFYSQELVTGEEDERTEYSCRAKLYNFATVADGRKEWKERGIGVVRLNVKKATSAAPVSTAVTEGESDKDNDDDDEDDVDSKPRARLLMRTDGSHRVILNTPVKKEIRFGAPDGSEPKNGFIYFMGAADGKGSVELLQLKVSSLTRCFLFSLILLSHSKYMDRY